MNWNDILRPYSNEVIGAMCNALLIASFEKGVSSLSRPRAIEMLRKVLGKPEAVRIGLKKVGSVEALIIKKLIELGGTARYDQLKTAILERGISFKISNHSPSAVNPDYSGVPRFEDAVARATSVGIIFSREPRTVQNEIGWMPGSTLFIPDPTRHVLMMIKDLREKLDEMANLAIGKRDDLLAPNIIVNGNAADFQRDLGRYWRHVKKAQKLSITAQGWVYKNEFKHVLSALNLPINTSNDEQANHKQWFIRRILTHLGDLKASDKNLGDLVATDNARLLTLKMADRIRMVFDVWRDSGLWNEVARVMERNANTDPNDIAPPELAKAHAALLRVIGRLTTSSPHRWVSFNTLIDSMRRTEYEFLFPRTYRGRKLANGTSLYQSPYYYENNPYHITVYNVPNEVKGWEMVEVTIISSILKGPLRWMGIVDVGYEKKADSETSAPHAFRLTEVGAWLLGIGAQPNFVESGGRVVVQPNFTILAMDPIPDSVLIELDRFSEAKGGERVLNYELTRQSVYRAQLAGMSVPEIIQFLETHQGAPIANNVRRTLEEWDSQHNRIVIRRDARLLQFSDNEAQTAIGEVLQLYGRENGLAVAISPIGSQFALLDIKTSLNSLVKNFTQHGWSPLSNSTLGSDIKNSVQIDTDGNVLFKHITPSFFTLSKIEQLSEQQKGKGAMPRRKITPDSIRAAMSKGMKLDDLLAMLKELTGGALDHKFETNVRSWAGFYGNAKMQMACLLELSNRDVLENLLKDKEIGSYLLPIEGSIAPIAVIDTTRAEYIARILRERGVILQSS